MKKRVLICLIAILCVLFTGCSLLTSEEQLRVDSLTQKALTPWGRKTSIMYPIEPHTRGFHIQYSSIEQLANLTFSFEDLSDANIPSSGDFFMFYNDDSHIYATFLDSTGNIAETMDYYSDKFDADSLSNQDYSPYFAVPELLEKKVTEDLEKRVYLYSKCKWLSLTAIQLTQLSTVKIASWGSIDTFHELTKKQMDVLK